jgi:hypothetical protein
MACMANLNDRHRVYMSFQDRNGWHCQFLEADLKTSLPKRLPFTSPDKSLSWLNAGEAQRRSRFTFR